MSAEPSSGEPQFPMGEPAQRYDAPTQNQWAPPMSDAGLAAPVAPPPAAPAWGQPGAFGSPVQPGPPPAYQSYPGYGGPMYPPPPMPPKKSRAWIGWVVGLVVVCVVVGGVFVYRAHNKNITPVSLGTPSPGISQSAGAQGAGQPGPGACDPQDLTSCLLATPPGSEDFTSGWGTNQTPTVAEYVQQDFTAGNSAQNASNSLNLAGVQTLAHAAWFVSLDGNQMDIVLFRFSDQRGAQSWALNREGIYMAAFGGTPISVPGDATAKGYTDTTPDSSGFIDTHYAQAVGDIAVVIRYSSKGQAVNSAEFQSWTGDQLARLQTGPSAGPESSAVSSMPNLPSFTSSSACAGSGGSPSASTLDGCLMPMPSGASPDTASSYDTTENPSLAQYVAEYWSNETADQQSYEVSLLQQYGAQAVAHRRWVTDSGQVSGDVVLLGFTNQAQAQGEALNQAGLDMPDTESCSSPSLPDAYCSEHQKDGSNDIWTQIIAWHGSVEMKFELNSYLSSADLADALTWAQTELELLGPASS
jgi:hypothetical protein